MRRGPCRRTGIARRAGSDAVTCWMAGLLMALHWGCCRKASIMKDSPCEVINSCRTMTYVVTESCIKCKYTDCVDVCPVDCFREGPNMLVIDPDECIDCTLCVPECPVEAIFAEDDVPDSQQEFIALNRELSQAWKPLIERKPAPADADEWAKKKDKKNLLER